jgi:DNA-binding transcriptional MerR regulator
MILEIKKMEKLMTVGEIARLANLPPHRILYHVKSRGIIPTCRPGGWRLFTQSQVEEILDEMKKRPMLDRLGVDSQPVL